MPENQPPVSGPARSSQVTTALWLVSISVAFCLLSGAVSVTTGLANHSLSVLAIGLGVLADVTGSAVLIWRFWAERRRAGQSRAAETRAAIVVAAALAAVSAVIIVQAAAALAAGSRPGTSGLALIAAGISLAVLTPLAFARLPQANTGSLRRHPRTTGRPGPSMHRIFALACGGGHIALLPERKADLAPQP